MKSFKSVVMVKQPHSMLCDVMRDRLSEFAHNIADIDSVIELERHQEAVNVVRITNEWKVRYQIPPAIKSFLRAGELGWLDHNRWQGHICSWSIEPFFLVGQITCVGQTSFESAMAGQGARVTLEGQFEIKQGVLRGTSALVERPLLSFAESIVTTVLPKNLRGIVEAAASHIRTSPS